MRRQIADLFAASGLARFHLAGEIDTLLYQTQKVWWKRLGVAILVSFVTGFGLCMAWYGAQIIVLQSNIASWKAQYDTEHAKHHAKEARPIGKAAAQVISQRLQDAREGKERE